MADHCEQEKMSDHTNGEVEAESAPGGSPPPGNGPSKKKSSPITPTPVKKSKRQAERSAKGAFAASLRKEEEESRLYQSKKQKAKKLPKAEGENSSSNEAQGKPKQSQSNGDKECEETLQVVTPSPIQSSATSSNPSKTVAQSSSIAKTNPSELILSGETASSGENSKRPRDKSGSTASRKRRRLVYKAVPDSTQNIYKYALDLVALVCNNAYSVVPPKKSTAKTPSPKNDDPSPFANIKGPQEAHTILDRPINGYTSESEPERERFMRLQLRQRFASASAIGMSPIEFAGKLLKRWGGKLEQVHETIKFQNVSSKKNNNCSSSLAKKKSKMKKGKHHANFAAIGKDGFSGGGAMRPYDFDKSLGDLEPRSIHPDARFGQASNGLDYYDSGPYNPSTIFDNNANPTEFNSNIFGESKARMERANKLLKRKYRKDLKKAEKRALAASSNPSMIADHAEANAVASKKSVDEERASAPKRKGSRRTPRKLMDNPSIPVLLQGLRLAHPDDAEHVNALHSFVRSKLLEVYVLKGETLTSKKDGMNNEESDEEPPANLVGIRCAFCGALPKNERGAGQTMAVFFPKSVGEIYRGVCTWQRIHFPVCQHMPESYRREYKTRKEMDLTRGKKAFWVKAAYDLGLRNIDSMRSGLTYRPDSPYDIEEVLKIEVDPGGRYKPKKATNKKSPRKDPQEQVEDPPLAGRSDEFELFGADFDRSLQEEEGEQ